MEDDIFRSSISILKNVFVFFLVYLIILFLKYFKYLKKMLILNMNMVFIFRWILSMNMNINTHIHIQYLNFFKYRCLSIFNLFFSVFEFMLKFWTFFYKEHFFKNILINIILFYFKKLNLYSFLLLFYQNPEE